MNLAAPALEQTRMEEALHARTMRLPLVRAFGLPESTPCHVVDAKYEPGASATVLYELGDRLATAVVTFDDGAAESGGVAIAPGVRAFAFPDDPRLPGLATAVDPESLGEVLAVEPGTRVRVELLRYRPGKRATLRIELRGKDAALTLIGKVYADGRKAAAVHDETRRLSAALGPDAPVQVTRAEQFLPTIPMVLWRPIDGTDLDTRLDGRDAPRLMAGVAAAVAAVHGVEPVSERLRPVDAELQRFDRRASAIERVDPATGSRLRAWAAVLVEHGAGLEHQPAGLVHGDCKPSQFRLTTAAPALLDWDHCGLADPASDVGTFLATLRQHGHAALESPFLDAYRPDDEVRSRVAWYQSVALLRKALRAFARSPRSTVPHALADEGLACIGRTTS